MKNKKLFSVCDNKMMAVTDIPTWKVVATPAIGAGPDAAGFDSDSGPGLQLQRRDGTLTIVKPVNGKYDSRRYRYHRARRAHHDRGRENAPLYLLAAEYGGASQGGPERAGRRPCPIASMCW